MTKKTQIDLGLELVNTSPVIADKKIILDSVCEVKDRLILLLEEKKYLIFFKKHHKKNSDNISYHDSRLEEVLLIIKKLESRKTIPEDKGMNLNLEFE